MGEWLVEVGIHRSLGEAGIWDFRYGAERFFFSFRGGIWELDPRSGKKENVGVLGLCGEGLGMEGSRVAGMEQLLGPSWDQLSQLEGQFPALEGLEGQFPSLLCPQHPQWPDPATLLTQTSLNTLLNSDPLFPLDLLPKAPANPQSDPQSPQSCVPLLGMGTPRVLGTPEWDKEGLAPAELRCDQVNGWRRERRRKKNLFKKEMTVWSWLRS